MSQEHERQSLLFQCDEAADNPGSVCDARHPKSQVRRYLVQIWGDVEPILHGPYDTEEARFLEAYRLARENYGCVFKLDQEDGEPYVESYIGNDLDPAGSPGQCENGHEWFVFSAALKEVGLVVRCVQCGAMGTVHDPSEQEWSEAFHAPPAQSRWDDDSRIAVRWRSPLSVEQAGDTQGKGILSPQAEGMVA